MAYTLPWHDAGDACAACVRDLKAGGGFKRCSLCRGRRSAFIAAAQSRGEHSGVASCTDIDAHAGRGESRFRPLFCNYHCTGQLLESGALPLASSLEWSADGQWLFYTVPDDTGRPSKVRLPLL